MTWIQTRSGVAFDLLEPTPDMVILEDIAFSLARQARFNGHCYFYSVAQHSVHCAELAQHTVGADPRECLMHDAAEAYLGDIVAPVKRLPGMEALKAIEGRVWEAIADRFGMRMTMLESTKAIDLRMLAAEKASFFPRTPKEWIDLPEPHTRRLGSMSPGVAEQTFLEMAAMLGVS